LPHQAIACGLTISAAVGTTKGLGLKDVDIPQEWIFPVRKCEYAFSILYVSLLRSMFHSADF
jgi:hypothetical protein